MSDNSTNNVLIAASNDDARYQKRFLDENVWFHVKVAKSMLNCIKYVAVYRAEHSAKNQTLGLISHVGKVRDIVPYGNTGGYLFNIESVESITPIERTDETKSKFQSHTYCSYDALMAAQNLTELERSWVN